MGQPLGENLSRDHERCAVNLLSSHDPKIKIKWVEKDVRIDAHQGSFGGKIGFSY